MTTEFMTRKVTFLVLWALCWNFSAATWADCSEDLSNSMHLGPLNKKVHLSTAGDRWVDTGEKRGLLFHVNLATGRIFRALEYTHRIEKDQIAFLGRDLPQPDCAPNCIGRPGYILRSQNGFAIRAIPETILTRSAENFAQFNQLSLDQALKIVTRVNSELIDEAVALLKSEFENVEDKHAAIDVALGLDEEGFPDEQAFIVTQTAIRLLNADPDGVVFGDRTRVILARLKALHDQTLERQFAGRNSLLNSVNFAEPVKPGANVVLRDYVDAERFRTNIWWFPSEGFRPTPLATINSKTAKSPFVRALGPGATSSIYWPGRRSTVKYASGHKEETVVPDFASMRIRVNKDATGRDRSLEMIAPVGQSFGRTTWEAFLFKKIGEEWVPASRVNRELKCIQCHSTQTLLGNMRLIPIPNLLKNASDFSSVGYRDQALIRQYVERNF